MNDSLRKIKKILKKKPAVEWAYLFGSRAKNTANQESDWDIAVRFKKDPNSLASWSIFYLEAELSREIKKEVQIIPLNGLDSPVFLYEILRDGIPLVDKNPESRILFEARSLGRYHDWKYFLNRQMVNR